MKPMKYLDFKTSAGIERNQYATPAAPPANNIEISSGRIISVLFRTDLNKGVDHRRAKTGSHLYVGK